MIVRNFLFHRVSPERDPLWDPIAPTLFARILRHLKRRFQVVSLEGLFLNGQQLDPGKPVCTIGFDDGYRDNIEFALPLLQEYDCPASFYVVTDCIDEGLPTWTYQIDYLFRHSRASSIRVDSKSLAEELRSAGLDSESTRLDYAKRLKPHLKSLENSERHAVLAELKKSLNDVEVPRNMMMSWDEVRSLHSAGFTVGSHSKTHSLLATIEDAAVLETELVHSRDRIEAELGSRPDTISYPIGSVNDAVVEEARRCGYRLGLATGQRICESRAEADLYRIPRIELYHEGWWKTRMRISGHLETIKKWIRN